MTRLRRHGVKFSVDDLVPAIHRLLTESPASGSVEDRSIVRSRDSLELYERRYCTNHHLLEAAMGLSVIAEGVETEEQREFSPAWAVTRFKATCSAAFALQEFPQRLPSFVDKAGAIPQ